MTYSSSYAGSRAFGSTQLSYQMAPLSPALKSSLGTGRVNVIDRGVKAFEVFVLDVIAVADRNDLLPVLAISENASDGWGRRRPMMTVSATMGSGTADRECFLIVVDVVMVRWLSKCEK